MHHLHLSVALLLAFCCTEAAQGQSFGRWRIPSTTAQVFGYGNGAGHHAPIVRTTGCHPPRVPRVAFVPCDTVQSCSCSANWTVLSGCNGGQCAVQMAPQQYQQTVQHPQIGQPFPTVAASQNIFSPPAPPSPVVDSLSGSR